MRRILFLSIISATLFIISCAGSQLHPANAGADADAGTDAFGEDAAPPDSGVMTEDDELFAAYKEVCQNVSNPVTRRGQRSRGGKVVVINGQHVTIFCD